jgi:hypothetical protein
MTTANILIRLTILSGVHILHFFLANRYWHYSTKPGSEPYAEASHLPPTHHPQKKPGFFMMQIQTAYNIVHIKTFSSRIPVVSVKRHLRAINPPCGKNYLIRMMTRLQLFCPPHYLVIFQCFCWFFHQRNILIGVYLYLYIYASLKQH